MSVMVGCGFGLQRGLITVLSFLLCAEVPSSSVVLYVWDVRTVFKSSKLEYPQGN